MVEPGTLWLIKWKRTIFAVRCRSGSAGGGIVAKDALGNDVNVSKYTKTHLAGDKSLVQGLKVRLT